MAEIRLMNLVHSYTTNYVHTNDYAIHEMNHVWEQGGALVLLRPFGCGNSILLNIISSLVKSSHGGVDFNGVEVNDVSLQDKIIASIFQFSVIYNSMTVYDNLAFPLRNMRVFEFQIDAKVNEVADVLEQGCTLQRKAKNLSADQKQKISLGRGLVRDGISAILSDDPFRVIDPNFKCKLRRKLKQIHRRYNITILYVIHNQLEASTFADKIALMYEGKIVQFSTPRELFANLNHTFVGYFMAAQA